MKIILTLTIMSALNSFVDGQEQLINRKFHPVFLTSNEMNFSFTNTRDNSSSSILILKKDMHPLSIANIKSMEISDELLGMMIGGGAGFAIGYYLGTLQRKDGIGVIPPSMGGIAYAIVGGGVGYFIGKAIHKKSSTAQ